MSAFPFLFSLFCFFALLGGRWMRECRCSWCVRVELKLTKWNSPVKSVTPMYPGKVVVKMGMFPRIPEPEFETFGIHRHTWQGAHEGVTQFKVKMGGEKLHE